jgi:hypothetical protein
MNDRLEKKVQGGFFNNLLIIIGVFLFVGGLLGPSVSDLLPAEGFSVWSAKDSYFRIVPAKDSSIGYQLVFMLVGAVLLFAGIILRRRG